MLHTQRWYSETLMSNVCVFFGDDHITVICKSIFRGKHPTDSTWQTLILGCCCSLSLNITGYVHCSLVWHKTVDKCVCSTSRNIKEIIPWGGLLWFGRTSHIIKDILCCLRAISSPFCSLFLWCDRTWMHWVISQGSSKPGTEVD